MINDEVFDEFLNNLLDNALDNALTKYKETADYEYVEKQRDELDLLLRNNLDGDQKSLVDEYVFQLCIDYNRENKIAYRQGLKDCVWILKSLGVLA